MFHSDATEEEEEADNKQEVRSSSCRTLRPRAFTTGPSGLVPLLLDPQASCLYYWTLRPRAFTTGPSGLVPWLLDLQAPCLLYWTLRPCAFLRQLPDKTQEYYHFVRKSRGYRRPRQKPSDFVSARRGYRRQRRSPTASSARESLRSRSQQYNPSSRAAILP